MHPDAPLTWPERTMETTQPGASQPRDCGQTLCTEPGGTLDLGSASAHEINGFLIHSVLQPPCTPGLEPHPGGSG